MTHNSLTLYLLRHGHYTESNGGSLSSPGRETIQKMADKLNNLNISLDVILHSGKPRAMQSAHIIEKILNKGGSISPMSGLKPNDDPSFIISKLQNLSGSVMLVSHLPFLDQLATKLITAQSGHNQLSIFPFQMGSLLCLRRIEKDWHIEWFLHPYIINPDTEC